MADNALTMFDPKAGVPAHIAAFFGSDEGSNIESRATVNSLSPQGKVWTISLNGTKTQLMRVIDGETVPVNVMKVVILDYAKRRGRAYYEGAYDPAKESAPICWSDDGIAPDSSLPRLAPGVTAEPGQPHQISPKCESCPMAVKGSKVTDQGKSISACSQHRMLVVVPANKLDFPPLRLKIAITSDWDKQSPAAEAAGWYGFQNYTDFLKSRGASHTAAFVTKMKFDPDAAYPKIFFGGDRWLEPAELAQVIPLTKSDEVKQLLGGTWTPAGPDGVKKDEAAPAPAAAQPAAQAADDDDGDGEILGLDAPAAEPAQGAAQAGSAPAAAEPSEQAKPAATATTTAPAATAVVDPALAELLKDWGND